MSNSYKFYSDTKDIMKKYVNATEGAIIYGISKSRIMVLASEAEVIEAATNEARKEVIKLLGGVISGMNVGQPVIMQAANSEAQEPTEDVMDDADVAGLAMGWMSKGD